MCSAEGRYADRRKRSGAALGLVLVLALLCACGRKQETEKTQLILTIQGSEAGETKKTDLQAAPDPEDQVNGFRFESCDEMVYCIGEGVKLRDQPGLDGEEVGVLPYGAYVQRIGKNKRWSRILVNGLRVYAAAEYLSAYPPETEAEETKETKPEGSTETKPERSAETKAERSAETKAERSAETKVKRSAETKAERSAKTKTEESTEIKAAGSPEAKAAGFCAKRIKEIP